MMIAEIIISVLHPALTLSLGGGVLAFYLRLMKKYGHICFNKYDIYFMMLAVLGWILFDSILLAYLHFCGSLYPLCANVLVLSAISRLIKVIMLVALLTAGHHAQIRQRKAQKILGGKDGNLST